MPLVGIRKLSVRHAGQVDRQIRASLLIVLATLVTAAVVAACGGGTQPATPDAGRPPPGFFPTQPATQQAQYIFDFYPIVFFIAAGVFLLVEGLLLWIVFRYRRRPTDDQLPAQTHGHNVLEIIWTLIPAAIVTFLFAFTIDTLAKVERNPESAVQPSLTINVTGFQWQWTFEYPEQGLTLTGVGREGPTMALPIDETVRIRLAATDVIHSFYVPEFLYKKDAVPGRINEFDVMVQDPGIYAGQCAEFCGLAHSDMLFTVHAMTRAEFDAWVVDQQRPEPSQQAPPSGAPSLQLTAVDSFTFDPPTLSAPADLPMAFAFTNADPAQPHNVAIVGANTDGTDWIGLPIAQAGQSATYVSPPLAAGTYEFYCSVHPTTMRGSLNVGQ